jgi:hypothetical protein
VDYPVVNPIEQVLARADEFFGGYGPVQKTAEAVASRLREAGIDFAVAGALALGAHGFRRFTEDVDIVISREGLARFQEKWLGHGYTEVRPGGKAIRDTETKVKIDFLISGDFPGDGKPKPVSFPEPAIASISGGAYPVISLPRFIELKLASGMTAPHRLHDLADVIRLIRARRLPRELESELNSYVRAKYLELWQAAQQEDDEY